MGPAKPAGDPRSGWAGNVGRNESLTSVQQSHLGAFLVRHGQDVLETGKAFAQVVAAALLRLDALAADFLAAARNNTVYDVSEDPDDHSRVRTRLWAC